LNRRELSVQDYIDGVIQNDRTILARAITLVESNRRDHQILAQQVLDALMPRTGAALRVGITGVPGVGKSTFIESLGMSLVEDGQSVAVLAIDPTSSLRGGSILGDKTRMARLSMHGSAFIRPSPSQGSLGGVHRKTRETMLLCEAAGFDVILVETVGVGQSETRVADMVDTFLVLMLSGAGDELQGIKKGILEVADILAINKADGDNKLPAEQARRAYKNAIHLFAHRDAEWTPPVLTCSATQGDGIIDVWNTVLEHRKNAQKSGIFERRRHQQQKHWLWDIVEQEWMARFRERTKEDFDQIETQVVTGTLSPTSGALKLLAIADEEER
jgi:LAO/AO transport system kinase